MFTLSLVQGRQGVGLTQTYTTLMLLPDYCLLLDCRLNKASYLTYAYTALMQSQLEGLTVADPNHPGATVDAMTLMPALLNNGRPRVRAAPPSCPQ